MIVKAHPLVRLVHELRDALASEVVHHLDLDLLEDLRPLLSALSGCLEVKLVLRCIHVNLLDWVLIVLCRDNETVGVVWRATRTKRILGREGGDALQDNVDELNIE